MRRLVSNWRQLQLVFSMTCHEIFNRTFAIRLLIITLIPFWVALTTPTLWNNPSMQSFFFSVVFNFSFFIYPMTMFGALALAGWLFASPKFKLQVRTLLSHPVSVSLLYISRFCVLVFVISLLQFLLAIGIFVSYAAGFHRYSLFYYFEQDPGLVLELLAHSFIVSLLVGFILASVLSIFPILFKRTSVSYILNFLLLAYWYYSIEGLRFIMLEKTPWLSIILSVSALIANSILQWSEEFRADPVADSFLRYPFTFELLVLQLLVWFLIIVVSFTIAWLIFIHRCKTW